MAKEGSSDYKKVRKRWFFKEPLTEWFFYGIAVKNCLSTFIFKSVSLEQNTDDDFESMAGSAQLRSCEAMLTPGQR